MKVWELRQRLDEVGDDVEVGVETDDGEYEVADLRIPPSGPVLIQLGELKE